MTPNLQFYITKSEPYITLKNEVKKCLKNVIKVYKYAEKLLSITQVAYIYSVSKVILYYRINIFYNQILYKIWK